MAPTLANRRFTGGAPRGQLLGEDRVPEIRSARQLVDIAATIEAQAIDRYRTLSGQMARKGYADTARAFSRMAVQAETHAAAVDRLAERLGLGAPDTGASDILPSEFAASWEEVRDSALLTPYRALAIAVRNEQRAFAFYSYLAAHAADPAVAKEAEGLARTKLLHAAALRRWRRSAYRQDGARQPLSDADDAGSLSKWVPAAEREVAVCHRDVAHSLKIAGDEESAALLRADSFVPFEALRTTDTCRDPDCRVGDPIRLLTAAQRPLERLSERLEAALDQRPDEAAYRDAQHHLERTILRLGRIKRRVEDLMRAEGAGGLPKAPAR
jgi:rubrerythrin